MHLHLYVLLATAPNTLRCFMFGESTLWGETAKMSQMLPFTKDFPLLRTAIAIQRDSRFHNNWGFAATLPPYALSHSASCRFHLNYLRFLGLLSEQDMKWVRGLWLLNSGTVSVAVFLHTMRFKKLIAPRVNFSCYAAMPYASFFSEFPDPATFPTLPCEPRALAFFSASLCLQPDLISLRSTEGI